MKITRLESETLEEHNQRKEEDDRKKEDARKRKEEEAQRKEEARQRKEEQEEALAAVKRKELVEIEEHARQRKEEQEKQARQQKEEQEKQAPKARGKNKTFDEQIEDMKRYKETHGHVNVLFSVDKSLAQFCSQARHKRTNPGKSKGKQLTIEHMARLDALGFNWTTHEYVTRSFDERIEDLKKYKRTHGHFNVKIHEDSSLYKFCADVRYSLKQYEKDDTKKLTKERIEKLDDIGFSWS